MAIARSWSWTRRFIVAGVGGTANKLPRLAAGNLPQLH